MMKYFQKRNLFCRKSIIFSIILLICTGIFTFTSSILTKPGTKSIAQSKIPEALENVPVDQDREDSSKLIPDEDESIISNGLENTKIEGIRDGFPPVPRWTIEFYKQSTNLPIFGKKLIQKKFISLGISTVYREEEYLKQTLQSLLDEAEPEELELIVIVIYLADTDLEKRKLQLKLIVSNFRPFLDSGLIQITNSSADIYPPLNFALTKRTFNDLTDRVKWRSKQVIDFAFLFSYVNYHQMSDYHMIVDDDVIASYRYITAIQDFINLKKLSKVKWTALHFTNFLGIGLLFHKSDLAKISEFLLMFYQDMPVDMLIRKFIDIENPGKTEDDTVINRFPSIFQHIGKSSTLPKKSQEIIDSTFNLAKRRFKNQNPKVMKITTTMKIHSDFMPSNAYSPVPGWFWGIPLKPEETFDIIFNHPLNNISRIVILSGLPPSSKSKKEIKNQKIQYGDDFIRNGTLQISSHLSNYQTLSPNCKNFVTVGKFENSTGEIDVNFNELSRSKSNLLVQCIRIVIQPTKFWTIIREIEVFSKS